MQLMDYNDHPDLEKLNELLEAILTKPFTNSFVAVNAIRAALNLYGITLPKLEIEQNMEAATEIAALRMLHTGKHIPPKNTDCEYAYKLTDPSTSPDDLNDTDSLYLYMCIDLDTKTTHYNAYAQIVNDKDLNKLLNMDVSDMDHDDDVPETKYDQRIRHTADTGGDSGFDGEKG